MTKEALKLALEALEFDGFTPEDATHRLLTVKATAKCKEALAQPAQEPVKKPEPVAILSNVSRDEYLTRFYIGSQQTIRYLEIENQQLLSSGKVWKNEGSRLIAERDAFKAEVQLLKAQLAQPSDSVEQEPEQEPVGRVCFGGDEVVWADDPPESGTLLYTTPPQRKPLTEEEVNLFINGRGDEDDEDYVEPTGDGFGLTDADLVRLVRRVEAAHGIKKENT